ncbi:PQQ-dependent sugar dehydrogenase [Halobacteriovorax sp. GB3]|uniref:PQQ-dependent sugar dehydrogenase n=1 Tax=Halobacteriovorax sp. GB3 TaxID=2719615 RepID=UPI0023600146|nr:PQQ-dependent sugar dehydrogenase [Halobacteriovorax sp. GB3]MDD0852032.1 PQQ-dependent sugar dehydrogenase [Halobacteriovorax sp. GB3]
MNYLISILLMISFNVFSKESSSYLLDSKKQCFGYDQVPVSSIDSSCVGMIINSNDGLKKPRKVIQLDNGDFYITDMVNWNKGNGILWRFSKGSLKQVFSGLNLPHGLRKGPNGLVYVGESDKIFRFNPNDPNGTKEIVISNLPSDGKHPLSEFLITRDQRILVNLGAPSDQCLNSKGRPVYPCLESDREAALYEYEISDNGKVEFTRILARGLRNSMGIVELESGEIIQFNNGMDFNDEEGPLEEINLIIEDSHYGWPYCYEKNKLNKAYKRSFFNRSVPKINCEKYELPIGLLPAHSAPLDALLYQGEMFPELEGSIIVSLHGYRKYGQRLIHLNLNTQNLRNEHFTNLVFDWNARKGLRPKGAPVGLHVGKLGEIYFIDDKNKTLMVLAKGEKSLYEQKAEVQLLTNYALSSFQKVSNEVLSKHCLSCHSEFLGEDKLVIDRLVESGLVEPGKPLESDLYLRAIGKSSNMAMPPARPDALSDRDKELIRQWILEIK